jgi:hypothetical protein
MPDSPQRDLLMRFLNAIEAKATAMYETETQFWINASISMIRAGMDVELQRMILPSGRLRHMGVPVALMPRYLRLPPSEYPWGLHRRTRV